MKTDWLDEIEKSILRKSDPIPKGFVSLIQAAEKWGISQTAARNRLKEAIKLGMCQKIPLKISSKNSTSRTFFYGPK